MRQSCRLPSVTQIDGRAVRALKADWKQSAGCAFAPPLSSVHCAAAFYPLKGDDKARTQSLERLTWGVERRMARPKAVRRPAGVKDGLWSGTDVDVGFGVTAFWVGAEGPQLLCLCLQLRQGGGYFGVAGAAGELEVEEVFPGAIRAWGGL